MFLQSCVTLPPSAYPQYLMRHETGSEHKQVVYFPLANREQQKVLEFIFLCIVEEMDNKEKTKSLQY